MKTKFFKLFMPLLAILFAISSAFASQNYLEKTLAQTNGYTEFESVYN